MGDFASSVRRRGRHEFYNGAGKLIALDPAPRMKLVSGNGFSSDFGVFVRKASTGVNAGTNPVTNGSLHVYTAAGPEAKLANSRLCIRPIKNGSVWNSAYFDTYPGFGITPPFAIKTKFRVCYGFGPGGWPSGWGMHGIPHDHWPTNEEDDAWEWINAHPDRLYFTSHYDDPFGSGSAGHKAKPDYTVGVKNYVTGVDPTIDHEVTMIVRAGVGIEWLLDDEPVYAVSGYNNAPTARLTKPFAAIINFAVGGTNGFPDNPDVTTNTGAGDSNEYQVDYFDFYSVRDPATTVSLAGLDVSIPSVTMRGDGTDVKLVKDDGSLLFPTGTGGGGTGGDPGTDPGGGTGGTGLPPAGPHALFNPSTSPTRVAIDWDSADVDPNARLTTAMLAPDLQHPYVSIADSGVATYYETSVGQQMGTLKITTTVRPAGGTFTFPCPVNAQPSVSGQDGPIQLVLADGRYVDVYAVTGDHITWSGTTGTCQAQGVLVSNWKTGTGWPTGTSASYVQPGFTACGAAVAAGPVTPEDVQLGYIAHAANLVFNNNGLANGPRLPATRQDSGSYPSGNTIWKQGTLLALVPRSRGGPARPNGWTAWDHAIADMFENYGGYVMDRTGGFTMRATALKQPGVTANLTAALFAGFQSMAAGSLGRYLFDNLRQLLNAKPGLNHA